MKKSSKNKKPVRGMHDILADQFQAEFLVSEVYQTILDQIRADALQYQWTSQWVKEANWDISLEEYIDKSVRMHLSWADIQDLISTYHDESDSEVIDMYKHKVAQAIVDEILRLSDPAIEVSP